jgi:hypothetical protein
VIVEPFERDRISDREVVDRRPMPHVSTMEEDLAAVRDSDDAMAGTHEQSDHAPGVRDSPILSLRAAVAPPIGIRP